MPAAARTFPWFATLLVLTGCVGLAAAWVAVAMISGRQSGWMALLAALDAAFLLRLGGALPGTARGMLGVLATALTIILAYWGIVAAHLAGMLGLGFSDAAVRLGPSLVWMLSALASNTLDLALLAASLILAALLAR